MSRPLGLGLLGGLLALGSLLAAASLGTVELGVPEVARTLGARLGIGAPADPVSDAVVWGLRLPRAVAALGVGGGLAVVGAAMQALVRNPLAEPYILGVSSGASAGASLFFLGLIPPVLARAFSLPVAAFAGALGALVLVLAVARTRSGVSTARLLLAGVAVSALLGAVASFVTFASPEPDRVRTILFWLLGSFAGVGWGAALGVAAVSVGAAAALTLAARPLDALLTGEEAALSLGVPVEALKRALIGGTALVTGVLVAASGVIGFVGLIVPHAVRFVVGASHRRVVPLSFVAGGVFLLWADMAARLVLPGRELPVGILTAFCGVPFFLVLLRRTARL